MAENGLEVTYDPNYAGVLQYESFPYRKHAVNRNQQISSSLFTKALRYIPGGVNSPARSFRAVEGEPVFIARGRGSHVWDVDGNEYVDYLGSWGPLILGHAYPSVVDAVKTAAEAGTSFGAPTEGEVELAQLICEAFPSVERVRLVNSGTEACMSAIRLARAYTGRDKIVKFAGCYHGHADGLLVEAGSGALTHGIPTSAGVPQAYAKQTLVAEYNDLDSVERCFAASPKDIAGVIVEPVAGNMGVVPPSAGFLEGLRRITSNQGALLVFDEVITGFRVAYGGAQALYGVTPDVTCLGKIIGGGLPVGAYGGGREIIERVAPEGPMYQAGTLSGNPLAVSAGVATLKALRDPRHYQRLESLTSSLVDGLMRVSKKVERPVTINRVGSMFTMFSNPSPVHTYNEAMASDAKSYARFFHRMLEGGIYLPPSQYEAAFLSLAHTEEDIEVTLRVAQQALGD